MQIVETIDVLNAELALNSTIITQAAADVAEAIRRTNWPHNAADFTIHPLLKGNGVKPIKLPCMAYLSDQGWETECLPRLASNVLTPGDMDAMLVSDEGVVLFEWETGNISSSHRAINKLLLGMQQLGDSVLASFLVIPSNALAMYLTDRVGNMGELRPYLPLWRATPHVHGLLRILVVQHDATSLNVPLIPKGRDGMAIQAA